LPRLISDFSPTTDHYSLITSFSLLSGSLLPSGRALLCVHRKK